MGIDIIVADETFRNEGKRAKEISDNSETTIAKVVEILTAVCEQDLTDGNVAENLKTYTNSLTQLKGQLGGILEYQKATIDGFIEEVDAADDYYYPADVGGSGTVYSGGAIVRDFSEEMKSSLLEKTAEDDGEFSSVSFNLTDDMESSRAEKVTAAVNYKFALEKMHSRISEFKEVNNTTSSAINTIWANVEQVDSTYGTKFKDVYAYLEEYNKAVKALAEVIKPVVPYKNGFAISPEAFANKCIDILAPANEKAASLQSQAVELELKKILNADGSYNWDYIQQLLNTEGGILSNTQLQALSNVYTDMDGEAVEKFLSLGYAIPPDYEYKDGKIYYKYPNIDGTYTLMETQTFGGTPEDIERRMPMTGALWYFSQYYAANATAFLDQILQNGGLAEGTSQSDILKMNSLHAHSQILIYNMAFFQTAVPPHDPLWTNVPSHRASNITINADGSFSMGIAYEYNTGIPDYDIRTKMTVLNGSPLDINEGLVSQWYHALSGAEDDVRMAQEQKDKIWGVVSSIGSLATSALPFLPEFLGAIKISKDTVSFVKDAVDFQSDFSTIYDAGDTINSITSDVKDLSSGAQNLLDGKTFTRTEAAQYISQLNILGATVYAVDVEGNSTISCSQIDGTIAYFNWLAFNIASENTKYTFEEFVAACQNPNASDEKTSTVTDWYKRAGNSNIYVETIIKKYGTILQKDDFKASYSNYTWSTNINDCTKEQLDIIYDYYEKNL